MMNKNAMVKEAFKSVVVMGSVGMASVSVRPFPKEGTMVNIVSVMTGHVPRSWTGPLHQWEQCVEVMGHVIVEVVSVTLAGLERHAVAVLRLNHAQLLMEGFVLIKESAFVVNVNVQEDIQGTFVKLKMS